MTLFTTLLLFITTGAGAASILRFSVPGTMLGRIAFWYLAGIAAMGASLHVLGALGVRLTSFTVWVIVAIAAAVVVVNRSALSCARHIRHPPAASLALYVPIIALTLMASVLPIRDYDGRATWLPKALAISGDGTIDGPFFQGRAGLNLHNEYPLLMPLNAAAVMVATSRSEPEAVGWLYALVSVAALLAARDLIAVTQPRSAAWVIAYAAWLPMFLSVEGGALAAYNDVTVLALTGASVVSLHTPELGRAGMRAAALFLPALVLLKNEGVVIALSVLLSAALMRRLRGREWVPILGSIVSAVALLLAWRARVPAAYDEQYDVLLRTLPDVLHRLPLALGSLAMHGSDRNVWAFFWPVTLIASVVALSRHRRAYAVGPLLVVVLMFGTYALTFAVTSWNIAELANVAASRLLLHLVIPACFVIAVAAEPVFGSPSRFSDAERGYPALASGVAPLNVADYDNANSQQ